MNAAVLIYFSLIICKTPLLQTPHVKLRLSFPENENLEFIN